MRLRALCPVAPSTRPVAPSGRKGALSLGAKSLSFGASGCVGRPRNELAGGTYHVVARGVDRRRIFVDDEDYATYVRLLASVTVRQGWRLLAFCLMPNHVHLVIELPEANLGNGMQWLHSKYARHFNDRHHRVGHLFEAKFKSPLIKNEMALARTIGYVVANPVKAVLCQSADQWEWGSHSIRTQGRFVPRWIAHRRLLDRLEPIAGPTCYDDLVETGEATTRLLSAGASRPPASAPTQVQVPPRARVLRRSRSAVPPDDSETATDDAATRLIPKRGSATPSLRPGRNSASPAPGVRTDAPRAGPAP